MIRSILRSIAALAFVAAFTANAYAQTTQPPQFTISTVAGNGIAGFSGDGGLAINAAINNPRGVATDKAGNVYIADHGNARIRKVSPDGIITTVAGNGTDGFSGDGGTAISAQLSGPYRVRPDSLGNLYIADAGNNRIRRVAPNGIITTIAGNGIAASTGDGGLATSASLNYPADAVPDGAGNLFIVESFGECIRRVDAKGIITTVAGNGLAGYSGDGGPATKASLNNPNVLSFDPTGNLVISDEDNNRIRSVVNGIITTLAGDGIQGYAGDGGKASAAACINPSERPLIPRPTPISPMVAITGFGRCSPVEPLSRSPAQAAPAIAATEAVLQPPRSAAPTPWNRRLPAASILPMT
jgi:hypothetical protein